MQNIFLKSKFVEAQTKFRNHDFYSLVCLIAHDEQIPRHLEKEEFLLQKAASEGDDNAMSCLADYIFYYNDKRLPQALSWWYKAASVNNRDALQKLKDKEAEIEKRIMHYRTSEPEYSDIEVRLAMLTEWCMTDLGRVKWETQSDAEKKSRCKRFIDKAASVTGLRPINPEFSFRPTLENGKLICDGYADPGNNVMAVNTEALPDYQRTRGILLHELGHFVCFSTYYGYPEYVQQKQRARYGITQAMIDSWKRNEMGTEYSTCEEAANTLKHGVELVRMIYFGDN